MKEKYEHDVDHSSPSLEAHTGVYGADPMTQYNDAYHDADVFGDEEGHQVSRESASSSLVSKYNWSLFNLTADHVLLTRSITKPYHGNSSPC